MKEEDILDYLMTSEFSDDISSEESRLLLRKFRTHFRMISTKNEQLCYSIAQLESEKVDSKRIYDEQLILKNAELVKMDAKLSSELERKLTFMERLTGKINRK
jgi:hypothetical protein